MTVVWYKWSVRVNHAPRNLREHVAHFLRKLAQDIDGRNTLGIEIDSRPSLNETVKRRCINSGLGAIERFVESEVVLEANEHLLKRIRPELFEDCDNGQVR